MKFENYRLGYKIVSLAFDECAKNEFLLQKLNALYVNDEEITLYPNEIIISKNKKNIENLKKYNNFDVLEIWENGTVIRRYNDKSEDNYFFITGACNSNCIMCPSPEMTRKNKEETNMCFLMDLARHIPSDTPHLTITGGEPFLIGEKIFPFINYLKNKFIETEFLFLTNGRIFALEKYLKLFKESIPKHSIVAIPIHGSCSEIHDSISRTKKSFEQTKIGVKNLLSNNIAVELRLVVNKLNMHDMSRIADLIIREFQGVEYVSIIAMEMTGNAKVNKDTVWVPYKKSFAIITPAIRKLIENGIDVKLYNFPLCTVENSYWTLCEKSISENKTRYDIICDSCIHKKDCGGVFAGTFELEKGELTAIL